MKETAVSVSRIIPLKMIQRVIRLPRLSPRKFSLSLLM